MGAHEHGYYSILERKRTYHTASNRQPAEGLGMSDMRTVPVFSNHNNMVITKVSTRDIVSTYYYILGI